MRSTEERWEIGDRALAAEPVGRKGPRGGVGDRLDALADELGVPIKTLRGCRGVSNAWPKGKRRKVLPWSVHAAFRGEPNRFALIRQRDWTTQEAQAYVRARKSKSSKKG